MLTLIEKITEYILGHKYYSVVLERPQIFNDEGDVHRSMSGYIFRTKKQAFDYYCMMRTTRSFKSVEIVSFRSRESYNPFDDNYKI